jgi:hypothetical protein
MFKFPLNVKKNKDDVVFFFWQISFIENFTTQTVFMSHKLVQNSRKKMDCSPFFGYSNYGTKSGNTIILP